MTAPDVTVRVIELPAKVRGVTLPNADGTYSVYVNAALSPNVQQEALLHELYHIRNDHLYTALQPVSACEALAKARPKAFPLPE